jgi:hypothetical protein
LREIAELYSDLDIIKVAHGKADHLDKTVVKEVKELLA